MHDLDEVGRSLDLKGMVATVWRFHGALAGSSMGDRFGVGSGSETTWSSISSAESKSIFVPRPRSSSFTTEMEICFFLGGLILLLKILMVRRRSAWSEEKSDALPSSV
jgi:hypothetical protein